MRLVRSKDSSNLMGDGHVKIEDVFFFVQKVKVDPSVQLDHIKGLEWMTAMYPVCRVETKVFSLPHGNRMANQDNLFLGQLPKWLVIVMIENKAFNGDTTKNPYNFQHFDADYLALHVDGKQVPFKSLTPDFDHGLCTRSYASLCTGIGFMGHDRGNQISCEEYSNKAPDTHPGLHWVALFVTDNSIEYFDSYGRDPPNALHRWGKKKQWITNPIPLQSPLISVCGQYCLYYLLHRTRGIDMIDLLMDFDADVDRNDKLVYDFVAEIYNCKCHFSISTGSRIWSKYPKDGLDCIVLLLAAWQRHMKVMRFGYLGILSVP